MLFHRIVLVLAGALLLPSCISSDFSTKPNPAIIQPMSNRRALREFDEITIVDVKGIPQVAKKREMGPGIFDPYRFDAGKYVFTFQYFGNTGGGSEKLRICEKWIVECDLKAGHLYKVGANITDKTLQYTLVDQSHPFTVLKSKAYPFVKPVMNIVPPVVPIYIPLR